MPLETWLLYVATCFAATLTPGPAVLMTMSVGLRRGTVAAALTGMGVCAANAIWITLSVAGLSAVLLASATLFLVLKWAGACYLIYVGLRLILKRSAGGAELSAGPARARGAFTRGFLVQMTNPKAMIFFGALVPQFVVPSQPLLVQGVILAATLIVIEQLVLAGYGTLAAQGARLGRERWTLVTEKTSGALMIGAGLGLATLRRN